MLGWVLTVASAGFAPASPPASEPVPLHTLWDAPAECPDGDDLRAAIEEVVGRRLRFDEDAAVRVAGTVVPDQGQYRVDLEILVEGDREQRTVTAPDCVDAVDATALVVGLALEPFLSREALVPAPDPPEGDADGSAPETEAATAPASPLDTAREPSPAPQPERRRRFRHRAALFVGGGGYFALTGPAVGGVLGGVGWLVGRARIDLAAYHRFATARDDAPGARMSLSGAELRGCWLPRLGAFEVGPCGGVEAAALVAAGTGSGVASRRRTVPWVGLLAGVDGAWVPTPRFAIRASVAAGLVPSRPQLHLASPSGDMRVFLASPVNARLTLAVELRLPR